MFIVLPNVTLGMLVCDAIVVFGIGSLGRCLIMSSSMSAGILVAHDSLVLSFYMLLLSEDFYWVAVG
ncbi:MAG: hypothetical protein GY941_24655 [Planctomycetes bacterium]|nr:hypothetical protein [Planctomycetota bacterium]